MMNLAAASRCLLAGFQGSAHENPLPCSLQAT